MEIQKINFEQVKPFTRRDIIYRNHPEQFEAFYKFSPDLDGFRQAIEERKKYSTDRILLKKVIASQYSNWSLSETQQVHLNSLEDERTFTVVTAHQPSLFTGPMYYVYKIFSALNLAEKLKTEFPDYNFVPVFISGNEDHDFEEVNHLNLFGRRIEWTEKQGGPVGRYSTKGLETVIEDIVATFGNSSYGADLSAILYASLTSSETYNDLVFKFVNILFGQYGLLVLSMDDARFKSAFREVMKKEIFEHPSIDLIRKSQENWQAMGYGSQAHAREINLFYADNGMRERIVQDGDNFLVNNTDLRFSKDEMIQLIEVSPEKLSPNVVLRPLYEEFILPNLAYIGGGGELAYWLERKTQFQYFGIFYPLLIRRDSMLWISRSQMQVLAKNGMDWQDLFLEEESLVNKYISKTAAFDISLETESKSIAEIFHKIAAKAIEADKTLEAFVEAEGTKVNKAIDHIEQRIKRALKKHEETSINQLRNLKHKLFPNGGLQERYDNFMQFYLALGPAFFEIIKKEADPLQKDFTVIINY